MSHPVESTKTKQNPHYSDTLKEIFGDMKLHAEDLFLLESFQIGYLPDRVPKTAFATLLRTYPSIQRFLMLKNPRITPFIRQSLRETKSFSDQTLVEDLCTELLWEIADLIIYNKYPEIYDAKAGIPWEISEITSIATLEGKVVIDAGAGTGNLAFLAAPEAETVFAIEPVSRLREFMREKAARQQITNLYVADGFLHSIPLPDNTTDLLLTSNAIGWNLEKELKEIERVVKPAGSVVHLISFQEEQKQNPFHEILVSTEWGYSFMQKPGQEKPKVIYHKKL